jgi:ankyrin repeat protein
MDANGNDLEQDAGDEEEDPDAHAMRQILKETVKRRHDEAFQALAWAVTSGDLEEVRRMLRKGVGINASNYDGKTVLHMASVEGNYRVVELLLQEGAEKNKRDRWGNTALQDAINHNQGPVIQLLVQWKSELNNDNAAGRLCDAASAGDLDTLKLILEHGVDPNCGDYDSRTPLHLAAAEGQDKAVQYLIAKGADVNYKDRWGATPLQDAVQSGHLQVAEQILSRGGFMVTELGPAAMCNAATEGDVRYLKLLIRCGVDPDVGDYDFRCPMHLAAAEGRLLAVSYLLGVSANPNAKDRWGGTPMVRANVECLSGICAVVFLIGAAWQAFSFC